MLRAGYELVYEPAAAVHHSHRYSIAAAFRRFFDSGVSAERSYAAGRERLAARCDEPEPGTRGASSSGCGGRGSGAGFPTQPRTSSRSSPGLQLGRRHRRLPLALKRRFSALPSYWG